MSNTPTDEELDSVLCHHWPAFSMQAVLVQMWLRDAMRAALAKWGTPPPVVLESSEELYWGLHGLSKILEGSGLIDESQHPDAYTTILDAMAFIRGAQPVVREPLTDEQIDDLIAAKHFREGYELTASDKVCINWYRLGLRDGERAHGLTQKGGGDADT